MIRLRTKQYFEGKTCLLCYKTEMQIIKNISQKQCTVDIWDKVVRNKDKRDTEFNINNIREMGNFMNVRK